MSTNITFTVQSTRGHEEDFSFKQQKKVGAAADNVADEFGYKNPTNPTFVVTTEDDREELQRNRTIVSYDLDGKTVTLSDKGEGAA